MIKPTVCVDLDGVLSQYDGWKGIEHIGAPIQGAVQFTRDLGQLAKIVVYTTRCKSYPVDVPGPDGAPEPDHSETHELVEIVRKYLDKHGFHYDEIYAGQGKPFAVAYVDDRAVLCRPQDSGVFSFVIALGQVKQLVNGFNIQKDVSSTLAQKLMDDK